ncbi:MAG: peptide ABC transporter substrate-binding protein [Thermoleophilia bacterium]|nr:peptide ABC transporter substrate-binding protein [Thermoleophilia bacterium]
MTRRDVLKGGVAAGALLGLGSFAAACGGDETGDGATAEDAPVKGGILNVGLVGGRAADTADPHIAPFIPDDALNWLMYEGLMQYTPDLTPELLLAEEVSSNADGSEWTVRLKPDVPWHDGRTVSADDVVYSFKRIVDPKNPLDGAAGLGGLTVDGIQKMDDLTVRFTWENANVLFGTDGLTQRLVHIVPADFDPDNPIGCGPWKMKTFRPGEQFELEAFEDYHGGRPYLDGMKLIEFADPTARFNALASGEVDALTELPASQIVAAESQGIIPLNAKSGGWIPICMRIDAKPFTDVRVRQAFRLIPDRTQVLENAYNGIAWMANDMYSPFDKGYPADLPQREQDLEQAKSLLKQAGYEGLDVELIASDSVGEGSVAFAQVFAEQAKSAGVNVKVRKVEAGVLWGDDYLSWPFSMDYWGYRNYLQQAAAGSTPDAPYNETHWQNDDWYALVQEGFKTVDDAKRNELVREAATIEYNEGGYIIPTFRNLLDAYSDKVAGITTDDVMGISLGRWRFKDVYLKA